jgi:hypothetical protein
MIPCPLNAPVEMPEGGNDPATFISLFIVVFITPVPHDNNNKYDDHQKNNDHDQYYYPYREWIFSIWLVKNTWWTRPSPLLI